MITGRGNRKVHAAQPWRSNTSLRGVFFDEVGRAFLRSFFLFSFFFRRGKIEARDRSLRVAGHEGKELWKKVR